MTPSERDQVLDYINQFGDAFNDIVQQVTKRLMGHQDLSDLSLTDKCRADIFASAAKVEVDPEKFLQHQLAFLEKQQLLWQSASRAFMGEEFEPVIEEPKGDKRFNDNDWKGNPGFNYLKQAYLLNAEYMRELVNVLEFEDEKMESQVRFYTRQYINSISPSNYVLTNPEVCREILETQGENLAKGLDNFVRDLERSPAEAFKITQVANDAYSLGDNLAFTPGKVIFQNPLIQLIQYEASTEQVFEAPLLIIPPFINKYYILDLDEKKSLVRWLVAQGYSVFMLSWVNPDASHSEVDFGQYLETVIAALDVICEVSGVDSINAAGYCVGGTLLAIVQAYLKQKGDKRLKTLTLLTTLLDFSEPGEVGTYLSEQMLPLVEQSVENNGYLDGRILALGFSLLRENNLFWCFFIENYLKGKDPTPFDILYWNSDSTNIPAKTFQFYLKQMYLENKLIEGGAVKVNQQGIDLGDIDIPCYCLAARADHIVLWQSAFSSAQNLPAELTRFVLTESGHVAGVVNPASKGKYGHWVNETSGGAVDSAEKWLSGAEQRDGSWWLDWQEWLDKHSGSKVANRQVGNKKYKAIEDAPGSYVKRRLDTPFS